ncbi:hypothetical protein CB1_000334011 [Camelus ferus]|nr:hypothetical protein CB1_000334011 [Camelus ferus]
MSPLPRFPCPSFCPSSDFPDFPKVFLAPSDPSNCKCPNAARVLLPRPAPPPREGATILLAVVAKDPRPSLTGPTPSVPRAWGSSSKGSPSGPSISALFPSLRGGIPSDQLGYTLGKPWTACPGPGDLPPRDSKLLQSQDVKEDAVLCCSMELQSTGRLLEEQLPEMMAELLASARDKMLCPSESMLTRSLLLEVIELHANSWNPLTPPITQYYNRTIQKLTA